MNRKAQTAGIGVLITVAIAIIIGAILLQASAPAVATVNTLQTVVNESATFPAGSTVLVLKGQAVSNVVVLNRSGGFEITSGNYTITNRELSNGALRAYLSNTTSDIWVGKAVNVSYTYEAFGYATDSGSRVMIGLVLVFGALAVFVTAMSPIGDAIKDLF